MIVDGDLKNIYFVQTSVLYGNSVYLPYAAGALLSYAFLDEEIVKNYNCRRIIYTREIIDDAIASMEEPYLVGFSCYIWSNEYNKKFARRLKEKWPDCIIVFGGHDVPSNSPNLLNELSYVDILMHNECEVPFRKLLTALLHNSGFDDIPNISYRRADGSLQKNDNQIFDVADYPSPYQSGIFDEIVESCPYELNGMLETNRGCPFGCVFCDWGIYKSRVRQFPIERVENDIRWFAEHNIEFCTCADANFGILNRDNIIVDMLVESYKKTGFPSKVQFCYTKGREELVFEMNKRMNYCGLSKGATLSMQTLSSEALKNIGRKNPSYEEFCEIIKKYNELNIPTYSEIILGLPGETYDSFCEGLNKLLIAGQHNSVIVFNCELLLNSRMAQPETIRQFKIKSVKVPYKQHHCIPLSDEVQEYSNIVISTYSMSEEDWIRSNLFVSCLGCFHNLGLLQCFSIYMYLEKGMDYLAFYQKLLSWIFSDNSGFVFDIFDDIKKRLTAITEGKGDWKYVNPLFGQITWPYEEGVFLNIISRKAEFYEAVIPFLKSLCIAPDVFVDLLTYQKYAVKYPGETDYSFKLSYDMNRYLCDALSNSPSELQRRANTVFIRGAEIPEHWDDYARELVWYGKRGSKIINIRDFSVLYDE